METLLYLVLLLTIAVASNLLGQRDKNARLRNEERELIYQQGFTDGARYAYKTGQGEFIDEAKNVIEMKRIR